MTDYQIQGSTRRCLRTGREIRPGEKYYSALVDQSGSFSRQDFCIDGWKQGGPPPGAIGHWLGRLPAADRPRRQPIDDDLLVECLARLEGEADPARVSFRYVVALLLMRRKRLRLEETRAADGGGEVMVLRDAKGGKRHEVTDPRLADAELEAVQDEVFRVLGWD